MLAWDLNPEVPVEEVWKNSPSRGIVVVPLGWVTSGNIPEFGVIYIGGARFLAEPVWFSIMGSELLQKTKP